MSVDENNTKPDALRWMREYIASVDWRFAKTYAKTAPHEYTIRQWNMDREQDFEKAVTIIFKYGFVHNYYNTPMTYLTVDGWRYWPMDKPNVTNVINRAKNTPGWKDLYQLPKEPTDSKNVNAGF